jgi:antitoxin (DNA-binding transcriptional repressor) of toxin-antitoxin stability system
MCQVNVLEAKTSFSHLLSLLENEEEDEIVIARNGRPVARLVRWEGKPSGDRIGVAKGIFSVPEDFDANEDEIAALFSAEP